MESLLQQILSENELGELQGFKVVSGGSINKSYKVSSELGDYFIKYNPDVKEDFFKAEADGLKALKKKVNTPKLVSFGSNYLIQQHLDLKPLSPDFEIEAARKLAHQHLDSVDYFGWKKNNYIGSLPQTNKKQQNGITFMSRCRIQPLIKACYDKDLLDKKCVDKAEELIKKLPQILPEDYPSLLHGDLWSGNIGVARGKVYFFDPAVYNGYRETDLAMTRMFGGFSNNFYAAYNEAFPLTKNWEERIAFFQLYPLLVHLYLFGRAYYPEIVQVIKAYV